MMLPGLLLYQDQNLEFLDEKRETKIKESLVDGLGLQKSLARIREEAGFPRFPKGVFKFRSFEEADAWMMHYMTRPRS